MSPTNDRDTYDKLRTAVLVLDLVPGEHLSERGLEAMLQVSRTPIRAALMRLENEGLTRRLGRGWQVTPIDVAEIRAVMEYREVVEVAAVGLAIERAETGELKALRMLVETGLGRDDEASGMNDGADFHVALARLSRNPFLADAMASALTRLSRTRWLEVRTPESRAQARTEHLAIIEAVSVRDISGARQLVLNHSRGTRDRLLGYLTEERRRLRGRGMAIIESSTTPPPLRAVS